MERENYIKGTKDEVIITEKRFIFTCWGIISILFFFTLALFSCFDAQEEGNVFSLLCCIFSSVMILVIFDSKIQKTETIQKIDWEIKNNE